MGVPLGQPEKVTFKTYSDAAQTTLADPTSATIAVKDPTGAVVNHVWPGGDLTRESLGVFSYVLPNTVPGQWQWRAYATGAVTTSTRGDVVSVDVAFPQMLVSLSDIKGRLNIDPADTTQDLPLQDYLDSATVVLQNLYGDVIPSSYTERLRPYGDGTRFLVGRSPLLSVDSITVTWAYLNAPTLTLSSTMYRPNLVTGEIQVYAMTPAFSWQYAFRDWSAAEFDVTYTAGRVAVVSTVKEAVLALIQYWWTHSKASGSVTFGESGQLVASFGIPNFVTDMLAAAIRPRQIV